MRAISVALFSLFSTTAYAGTSHPTSWTTVFNNPSGVTASSGYSWDSAVYTCGAPADHIVTQEWTDFAWSPQTIGADVLEITWEADGYVGHGDVYIDIDYTVDGTNWYSAASGTYTSGGAFSVAKATTSISLGARSAHNLSNLTVVASLSVLDGCSGLVGSYSGRIKVHEIAVQR